ncbi:MAG: PEFG-CTERM sorting domain-containing protein [Candidatus Nitrosomaritimum aestuariumsis]|jgi:predicted secreted protein with PEFG-CTERM motif
MKMHSKPVFSLLAVFTIAMTLGISNAFAEVATVSTPQGTSVPGCEATNECYIPYEITINVGEEITWSNDDSAAHTVTAGSASDGPSGVFDSSLFMAGTTFSHTFEEAGTFPYFCMVHPWMEGIVNVGTAEVTTTSTPQPELISEKPAEESQVSVSLDHEISGGQVTSMTADGSQNSVIIEVDSTDDGQITVTLPRDVVDATIGDEDDEFFVLVDNEEVAFEETKTSTDRTLTIEVPAGTETIEIIGTFAIPEFGTIAAMILGIAIVSIIAITAKTKLSVMPRI